MDLVKVDEMCAHSVFSFSFMFLFLFFVLQSKGEEQEKKNLEPGKTETNIIDKCAKAFQMANGIHFSLNDTNIILTHIDSVYLRAYVIPIDLNITQILLPQSKCARQRQLQCSRSPASECVA